MYLPEWVQPFKEKRTEIKKISGHFYKYAVSFKYNKEKKKTEKKTLHLLGKITEKEGFVPSSKNELRRRSEELPQVDIKTFGVYNLFSELMKEEISSLTTFFGEEHSDTLLSFAMMRWAYQTPIKRAREYHSHDFCSEFWAAKSFSDKTVSATLKYFGENRQNVVEWMKTQLKDMPDEQNFVMMDSTHALSVSENLAVNAKGYNPNFDFEKQIRLMYLFSAQMKQPIYYRLINGNITDVKSMSLCINEMKVKDKVVFIADKGFFSAENIALMNEENLSYIIPLHRNNSLIDFSPLEKQNFKKELKYFIFQERIIWYYSYQKGDYNMITFLDEALRIKEERDYLSRIETHPESYSREGFDEKLNRFGTLTIIYKIDHQINTENNEKKSKKKPAMEKAVEQIIYESYKQRNEVEVMFDSYKNCLDADVSYMQNRYVLEGWLFANFIAMIAYYKLYSRLLQAELLSKYSPKDMIELSKAIYKMKIRNTWHRSEITQKIQRLFAKIDIDYLI
ncbi:IS4 family transposase [Bacteroidia bacterium]|nr:IS4 family transposase [Bacteroidia bacterium]